MNRIARIALLLLLLQLAACASVTTAPSNRDRVIVLVGASSGFGKGAALALADQGARLVLAARRTELLEELVRECERRGVRAIAVTTEVNREEEVAQLARRAVDEFGRIDVWINLAGVGALGRFDEIPLADHQKLIETNFIGVVNGSHHAMQQFRRQRNGTLINIGSVTGRISLPYYSTYAATKQAVVALGVALNQELRLNNERDIHVTTINPYAADTPWFQHAANYSGHDPWMAWMDPPERVVDVIVDATLHPRREIHAGWKSKLFVTSHRIARRLTERIAANVTRRSLLSQPPAPPTSGSVHTPMPTGTGVEGGERASKKQQDGAQR